MGVMIAIGVVIASIVGAAISQLLADEFKAWAPWWADRLIGIAIARLPSDSCMRRRFSEEWKAHLDEIPACLGKLYAALGFIVAVRRMRPEFSLPERAADAADEPAGPMSEFTAAEWASAEHDYGAMIALGANDASIAVEDFLPGGKLEIK